MNRYLAQHRGHMYRRVSARTAKRLHAAGQTVYVQSCKYIPFGNDWQEAYAMPSAERLAEESYTFQDQVNAYVYYNCDYERGYYASFYVACTPTEARAEREAIEWAS